MLHWAVQELACLIHDLAKFQNPGFMYKNLKALAFLNLKLLTFAFYYNITCYIIFVVLILLQMNYYHNSPH